jgi:hypothetical protein
MRKAILLLLILAAFQQTIVAQEKKEPDKGYKNTVHFNITNPILFGSRSLVFGYERVVNKRQSFSINFGTTGFPSMNIINTDSVKATKTGDQNGVNFSADYRFYLSKENKYPAPHGVYIGPYYSYNSFGRKNTWAVTTSSGSVQDVESDLELKVHTVGFELGYQFIFWDRVTLDMVLIGPGIAGYDLKASLGSNLSEADKEKLFGALNDALTEKFPGYGLVIDDGHFKSRGTEKTTSFGYRYMLQVGFRF